MNMNTVQCKDTVFVMYIVVLFDCLCWVCRLVASLVPSVFQHVVVNYGLTLTVCFAHLTPGSTQALFPYSKAYIHKHKNIKVIYTKNKKDNLVSKQKKSRTILPIYMIVWQV